MTLSVHIHPPFILNPPPFSILHPPSSIRQAGRQAGSNGEKRTRPRGLHNSPLCLSSPSSSLLQHQSCEKHHPSIILVMAETWLIERETERERERETRKDIWENGKVDQAPSCQTVWRKSPSWGVRQLLHQTSFSKRD